MNKTIKTVVAREGLVLLGAVLLTAILWIIFPAPDVHFKTPNPALLDKGFYALNTRGLLGVAYGVLAYSIYALIRFIIWAIGTLRGK